MDDQNRHLSKKEIIDKFQEVKGKTFGDFGLDDTFNINNKGGLGMFVEEHIFQYHPNNDDNPDFIDAGIELKVTPVKQNQNGSFSSKERLVLNKINYMTEVNKTFETSSFYHKNKKLLIWFYLWSKGIPAYNYKFLQDKLIEFDLEFKNTVQYNVIKRDWEIIHKKIVNGKAHEISESDTTFLAACTKGANSSILTKQPNSNVMAKPRAYSFKNGFMTRLFREILHDLGPYSSFVGDDEWMKNPLEEVYKDKLSIYKRMSISELKRKFNLTTNAKDICFKIAQKMLGLEGKATSTQEMADAGIKLKTIRLDKNNTPHESMSFPAFDFIELINKKWEESDIREDFVDWKLMFFVFKDDENGICRFEKVCFWNIPNSIVDGPIKEMFEKCATIVKNGAIIRDVSSSGKMIDNFPKESEERGGNGVCHVRPHGRIAEDVFDLPVPDKMTGIVKYTKQSFWFNRMFIKRLLKDL